MNPETAVQTTEQLNAIQILFQEGGFAVWLIALSALVLFVVGAERMITLFFKLSYFRRKVGFLLNRSKRLFGNLLCLN